MLHRVTVCLRVKLDIEGGNDSFYLVGRGKEMTEIAATKFLVGFVAYVTLWKIKSHI